jgi:HAD superfamily hydrolase (TIGR01509 family)
MAAIRAVLFDLGGVLVELGGEAHMLSLLGQRMTREEMWSMWLHSTAVRAHESGRITSAQFAQDLVAEFEIDISADEFLSGFKGWLKAPYPGAEALLDDTSRRFITGILSNTSAVHWPIVESMDLHHRVHHVVTSHELGQIKPDRAYFEQALKIVGVEPQETIFFDDNQLNVDGALGCGIQAHRVIGAAQTRRKLCELGLLQE